MKSRRDASYTKRAKGIKVNSDSSEYIIALDIPNIFLSIRFVSKKVINISYYKDKLEKNKYIELFEENLEKDFSVEFKENNEEYFVSNGYLDVYVYKSPLFYEIRKGDEVLLKQAINDKDITGNRYSEMFKFEIVDNDIKSIKDSFSIRSDEKFYGFGEKFSPINKRGYTLEAWNYDAFGVGSDKAYKNIPFFMNSRGYGFFINTTSRIRYNLASISYDSFTIEVEDNQFDYYFMYGSTFKKIIGRYTTLTGKTEDVPPKWSFGLWMSKYGYKTKKEVEEVVKKLRERNIPVDVIGLDPFWMRNKHWCDFVIDEQKFPNMKEMIKSMREKGIKFRIWIFPAVSMITEMFREGKENGYFLKDENGEVYLWNSPLTNEPEGVDAIDYSAMCYSEVEKSPPSGIVDFSNPDAVSWFTGKLKYLVDWGVGVIMCDFGEAIPENSYFFNGKTGKEMHNIYSTLYSSSVYKFMKKNREEKPICLIRSGWAGMYRYPICWSGDPNVTFEAMRNVLRGGLSLALTGVLFWSHDIGGTFPIKVDPRVYVRWAQFGFFTSHARCHGMQPKEPWNFGEEAERIFRKYDKLRYRLIPYIYSCAYQCVEKSIPFIKPLILEYQNDPMISNIDDEYIFGNSFLVAPVLDEKDFRYVYLPEGNWIDYWSKKVLEGGRNYRFEADINTLPLFVMSGSIIPMQEDVQYIENKPIEKLILDVYPGKRSEFIYKDDFESIGIKCLADDEMIELIIDDMSKDYQIVINDLKNRRVKINGTLIGKESIKLGKRGEGTLDLKKEN